MPFNDNNPGLGGKKKTTGSWSWSKDKESEPTIGNLSKELELLRNEIKTLKKEIENLNDALDRELKKSNRK